MAQSEPRRLGVSVELKPHAYDPATNPELFDGVVSRRVVAFLIDFLILSIPVVFVSMFIFVIGIVTFGLVPTCPMCHGEQWESARWSPFASRARMPMEQLSGESLAED